MRLRPLIAALLPLVIAACVSAPARYYVLEIARPDEPEDEKRPTVVIAPMRIPALIDRPQLVVRTGAVDVSLREQDRWASPLKDSLPRAVSNALGGACTHLRFAVGFGIAPVEPFARLSIDIETFELGPGGAKVAARWRYVSKDAATVVERTGIGRADVAGDTAAALVDGARQATHAFALDVARHLPECRTE